MTRVSPRSSCRTPRSASAESSSVTASTQDSSRESTSGSLRVRLNVALISPFSSGSSPGEFSISYSILVSHLEPSHTWRPKARPASPNTNASPPSAHTTRKSSLFLLSPHSSRQRRCILSGSSSNVWTFCARTRAVIPSLILDGRDDDLERQHLENPGAISCVAEEGRDVQAVLVELVVLLAHGPGAPRAAHAAGLLGELGLEGLGHDAGGGDAGVPCGGGHGFIVMLFRDGECYGLSLH